MRNTFLYILLVCITTIVYANNPYPPFMEHPHNFVERVNMTTDRDIYFVEETLFFEGNLISTYPDWSKIIYVEIISYDGHAYYQSKHKIDKKNNISAGIKLPDNISSGYYYIRAYTKWMRNYSQYNFFYKPILIINPFDNNFLSVSENYKPEAALDTIDTSLKVIEKQSHTHSTPSLCNNLKINTKNEIFCSISLVRKELINPYCIGIKRKPDTVFQYNYLPEIKGLTITGRISSDSISSSHKKTNVCFSVLGDTPYSTIRRTDNKGLFYFNIKDYYGKKEVMISLSSSNENGQTILIDNDFCNRKVKLPFISPLCLSKEKWNKLTASNINAQIEKQMIVESTKEYRCDSTSQKIYSSSASSFVLDDYIEMPTLKDYIYEVIPILSIRYKNGEPRLLVRYTDDQNNFNSRDALIIYDGIFIDNVKSFLDISPRKIERIEVINQTMAFGDIIFGGVVKIISKNKDITDLDLTGSGIFIDYKMLNEIDYQCPVSNKPPKRQPSYSNTALWTSHKGINLSQCKVPMNDGVYLLTYSQWDKGSLVRKAIEITVK